MFELRLLSGSYFCAETKLGARDPILDKVSPPGPGARGMEGRNQRGGRQQKQARHDQQPNTEESAGWNTN